MPTARLKKRAGLFPRTERHITAPTCDKMLRSGDVVSKSGHTRTWLRARRVAAREMAR